MPIEIIKNNDLEVHYKKIAEIIMESLSQLIEKDEIILGLCGGRSVAGVLKYLNGFDDFDWKKIHIFLIDERCVETTDPESNYKLIKENFDKANLHPFIIDRNKNDFGIDSYQLEFEKFGNKFDLILLSMGEDGHVGALYPNLSILNEDQKYFYLNNSPKPPSDRVTSSKRQMLTAKTSVLMIFGDSKREALSNFMSDSIGEGECPAKIVKKIRNSFVFTNL